MKAKKLFLPIVLSFAMAVCAVAFAGCAGQSDEEVIREALVQELDSYKNLDDAVVDEMTQSMDLEELSSYGIDGKAFMQSYFNGFDCTIDSVTVDGDKASAVITLTCKSLSAFQSSLEDALSNLDVEKLATMSEDELNQYTSDLIMNALDSVEVAQTEPITIEYTKDGNTWTPSASASDDIAAAMLSN